MRVTSDMFCGALVRTVFAQGGFAAIEIKGAAEAGAIFVVQRRRAGEMLLYGPAPQALLDAPGDSDLSVDARRFELLASGPTQADISDRLARERKYDPDIWVVELEIEELPDTMAVIGN
ncbi:MAG: DUF1491 family protein [Pseudomonadota bacterium]